MIDSFSEDELDIVGGMTLMEKYNGISTSKQIEDFARFAVFIYIYT